MAETKRQKSYKHGLWAESAAALYLMAKGFAILERRYKTKYGEIDLIVRDDDTLVFVEVKARSVIEDALEALGVRSQKRIIKAAEYYISQNPEYADFGCRFDLVALAPPFSLRHLDNAWQIHT